MLGVDEGAHAAGLLRLSNGVQGQRGLARRLGSVDFHHTAARQAADTEGEVESDRSRGNNGDVFRFTTERHDGSLAKLFFDGGYGRLNDL